MKIHKIISVILHPIVIPTIGVMLYFLLIPSNLNSHQKIVVLGLIFTITYLIPLLILLLFKKLGLIKTFYLKEIKERKLPVAIMLLLFYFLANTMQNIANLRDLGMLFYATSLGLSLIYISLYFNIKASIHLLSMGLTFAFFLLMSNYYMKNFLLIVIVILLLSGLLASARLYLKAHSLKEVSLGFLYGIIATVSTYLLL